MRSTINCVLAATLVAWVGAEADMTCFQLPNNKHPLECCNEPKLFPAELFTKCDEAFPRQPMPPPSSGKMKGSVSILMG
jgi:hypothetical protein